MTDFNADIPQIDEKENPISKASFESIDELFNKDPQFYTPENLAIFCIVFVIGSEEETLRIPNS